MKTPALLRQQRRQETLYKAAFQNAQDLFNILDHHAEKKTFQVCAEYPGLPVFEPGIKPEATFVIQVLVKEARRIKISFKMGVPGYTLQFYAPDGSTETGQWGRSSPDGVVMTTLNAVEDFLKEGTG